MIVTILNGSDQPLTDVNAAGVDVDPFSFKFVDLTNAELAALLDGSPAEVAVMADQSAVDQRIVWAYRELALHYGGGQESA
jgi:hypothetical protein